jgi:hypothetical protein
MPRNNDDFGQGAIDFFTARMRQDALEEAQEELESASGERRRKPSAIYRKGEDQSGLEEAAALQRLHDKDKRVSADDQSGYTGAKMAFTPFAGGVTPNTKALPVSGAELAKEAARRKSGAVDKFGMTNNEHKVDRDEQRKKGAY